MIWLSWRQFRTQAVVAGCVLAAFLIALAVTWSALAHLYDSSGLPGCQSRGTCAQAIQTFSGQMRGSAYAFVFYIGMVLIYVGPAFIGAFWGAPLVAREIETGTFRVAWNQSVSRNRWLAVKVSMVGLAAMAWAGLLSLMLNWWAEPVYTATRLAPPDSSLGYSRLSPLLFGINGIAPIGYAAFAFAFGLAAGVLMKRTLPAMAVTLAGFAFVMLAWPTWVRPHLFTPVRELMRLRPSAIQGMGISNATRMTLYLGVNKPGAWVLSDSAVNSAGRLFTGPAPNACISANQSQQACNASITALHLRQAISFQPASRFWPLQGAETGAYVLAAIVLALFCSWWISRRRLA
jgi:hypothetical protein